MRRHSNPSGTGLRARSSDSTRLVPSRSKATTICHWGRNWPGNISLTKTTVLSWVLGIVPVIDLAGCHRPNRVTLNDLFNKSSRLFRRNTYVKELAQSDAQFDIDQGTSLSLL